MLKVVLLVVPMALFLKAPTVVFIARYGGRFGAVRGGMGLDNIVCVHWSVELRNMLALVGEAIAVVMLGLRQVVVAVVGLDTLAVFKMLAVVVALMVVTGEAVEAVEVAMVYGAAVALVEVAAWAMVEALVVNAVVTMFCVVSEGAVELFDVAIDCVILLSAFAEAQQRLTGILGEASPRIEGTIILAVSDVSTGTSTRIFLLDLDDWMIEDDGLLVRSLFVSEISAASAINDPKTFENSNWM